MVLRMQKKYLKEAFKWVEGTFGSVKKCSSPSKTGNQLKMDTSVLPGNKGHSTSVLLGNKGHQK